MIMNDYCLLFRALLPVSLQEILAGGPTCRLYVKNLARQVEEEVSCHLSSGFFTPKPCLVLLSFEA